MGLLIPDPKLYSMIGLNHEWDDPDNYDKIMNDQHNELNAPDNQLPIDEIRKAFANAEELSDLDISTPSQKIESWVEKFKPLQAEFNRNMDEAMRKMAKGEDDFLTHNPYKGKLKKKSTLEEHYDKKPDFTDDISTAYFTPSIEDIRVGYECEVKGRTTSDSLEDLKNVPFYPYVVIQSDEIPHIESRMLLGMVRVPYLTKEQIEKEGWKPLPPDKAWKHLAFEKGEHYLDLFPTYLMDIRDKYIPEENCIFSGKCKDINTFRLICKLLEI